MSSLHMAFPSIAIFCGGVYYITDMSITRLVAFII